MTALYEASHEGERYVGFGAPEDATAQDAVLTLYPLGDTDLRAQVLAAGGDVAALTAALTTGREPRTVPAAEIRLLPPLLPDSLGDALVSGFMQTHNVKVDASTQSQPNWFFKGLGDSLKISGGRLRAPAGAVALTEEAEVVLVYVTDEDGTPQYAGYTFGNDLTDIGRFKRHAGHLSYAKLCDAGVAPWLFLGTPPSQVTGQVVIERGSAEVWRGSFTTGTKALHYGLRDILSELFSYEGLRHPGRVHYVYLGADRSSFHSGFTIADQDRIEIDFATHGVTLSHTVDWH
ncbi:FAH family protein [Streptomyces sp. NPDC002688]|uniref:FAH family protein n=1 Tax=Streptomyces sp. NPDC002688 TaxID=3154423 RepID=UPI00332C7FF6